MHREYPAVSILLLIVVAFVLLGAQRNQPAAPSSAIHANGNMPSQATVESFLQRTFSYQPGVKFIILSIKPSEDPTLAEVTVRAEDEQGQPQGTLKLFVTPDQKHAFTSEMIPFGADPFRPAYDMMKSRLNGASQGPADAKVLIVEFGDLECPACKAAQPAVDKMLADNPGVHFVFQQFPLTSIHPWAYKAAGYAQCITKQNNDAFWKFQATVYGDQENINPGNADEKLTAAATQSGVDGAAMAKCAVLPETTKEVDASMKLGTELGVTGTPTLYINGRKIANLSTVPPQLLKELIAHAPEQLGQ